METGKRSDQDVIFADIFRAQESHADGSGIKMEFSCFDEAEQEVFPGCPHVHNVFAYLNDTPGIGVGFDEKAAKKYPAVENMDFGWMFSRLPDGTAVRP